MRAWRVLLTSVVVHVVVLVAIELWWHGRSEAIAVETPALVEVSVVTPAATPPAQVMEVALVPDPIAAPVAAPAASVAHRIVATGAIRAGGAAPRASTVSTGEASGAATPGRGEHGKGMSLGMRGPELHPGDDQLAHIAEQPGHTGTTPIPSGRIESAPGGRAVVHDEVTTVTIDRDGTAHLHDKRDIDAHIDINPFRIVGNLQDAGRAIATWAENPEAGKQYGSSQDLAKHQQAVPGACDTWGDPMCQDPEAPDAEKAVRKRGLGAGTAALFGLSGKLDVTSYLMRKLHVGDAYSARKLKLLDDTRLERVERGTKYKEEQLAHSAQLMAANLERLWAGTRDLDERKAVLFELWDECDEGEGPTGRAGDQARAMVIGWIRTHLPEGTATAFTTSELSLLDQHRTSHQHFAPY